jgi:hypothetical protein
MSAGAVANKPKRYSPMAYNKATVRRRIADTAHRFKRSRIDEIEEQLGQALACMFSDNLVPFTKYDLRDMKFQVSFDEGGMVVALPELLKKWLNEL